MKKVAAITFGCKVNQYETACILDDFQKAGYEITEFKNLADVYIINSCTVTNRTDYKSRNAIRKALEFKKNNPDIKVIVTGCYVQINREKVKELGPVDLIVDNNQKNRIFDFLNNDLPEFTDIFSVFDFAELSTANIPDKARAFIKVQDGCNYFCAYCTVPYGRGNPRSRDPMNVIKQVETLVASGYKEFVLGGVNLGLYGLEKQDKYHLPELLKDLEQIEGVEIIRLSSIEPQLFNDELFNYLRDSKKIAPHFHIPLQSGSDTILKIMHRHYRVMEFRLLLEKLLELFPAAAVGLDIIAGLPGETDKIFRKTYELLLILPVTYLHVFSYSLRPGTRAAGMSGQVKGDIIKARSSLLTELSEAKKRQYIEKLISEKTSLKGIAEKKVKGYWTALSDHYIRFYLKNKNLSEKELATGSAKNALFDGIEVE
jgi:threonylcarbamoyladenosine tRNA methylthiotransferase MtaB